MKRQTKKILLASVAALLVIVLVAGLVMVLRKDSFGENAFTRNNPVATVNGEKITRNIFASSVSNYYNNISTYNMYALYGYGTYYDTATEEGMLKMKKDVLDGLIENEVYILMAKEVGVTLTDEEAEAVRQSGKDALVNLKEQILENAKSSGTQNPETYATTMLANYLSQIGTNQKGFVARSEHSALGQAYLTKLQEHFAAERNVQDSELEGLYSDYVQTAYVDTYTDGAYTNQADYVAEGYSEIPYLYIPQDFIFVRVIQLSDEQRANEIKAAIDNGEDFETYFASEENENAAAKTLAEGEGQPIGGNDSPYDAELYKQAGLSAIGEVTLISGTASNDDGTTAPVYYIVKRVEGQTGVVPYEQVKDKVDSILKSNEESKYFTEQVEAWKEKADIVIDDAYVQSFDPSK